MAEKINDKKMEEKKEVVETTEKKVEPVKEEKVAKKVIVKKEEAVAQGLGVAMSKRHAMYICTFIKNKKIDNAMKELEEVIILKRAIPFKGEIPHRKGDMMSGRYPVNASKIFITMLKGLKGNCIVNGLDMDKTRIYYASANWASRPARRGGRKAKRTNVVLKAKEILTENKKNG